MEKRHKSKLLEIIFTSFFFQLRICLSRSQREGEVLMVFKRFLKCSLSNQDKISPQKFHLPLEIFQLINDVNLEKNEFD